MDKNEPFSTRVTESAPKSCHFSGDGGKLNFLSVKSPVWLVFKLLDQIIVMGETAGQIKNTIRDASRCP